MANNSRHVNQIELFITHKQHCSTLYLIGYCPVACAGQSRVHELVREVPGCYIVPRCITFQECMGELTVADNIQNRWEYYGIFSESHGIFHGDDVMLHDHDRTGILYSLGASESSRKNDFSNTKQLLAEIKYCLMGQTKSSLPTTVSRSRICHTFLANKNLHIPHNKLDRKDIDNLPKHLRIQPRSVTGYPT